MKSPAGDPIEAESAALQREGRLIFALVCLVFATLVLGALALHLNWFD